MPRPIQAGIDLSSLCHNYRLMKANARRVWAVVKANAYGHGLLRVAAALNGMADGFALLDLEEGVALREAGYTHPILLLEGFFEPADIATCVSFRLIPAIHSIEQIRMLDQTRFDSPFPVYLKLNTGMNRLGLTPERVFAEKETLLELARKHPLTLMTHFADADAERGIDWQMERLRQIQAIFPKNQAVSVANSATLLRYPPSADAWGRAGIVLYGGSPFGDKSASSLGLKPVMTLKSRILTVQTLNVGERVGYGGLFTAKRPTRIGIVACGYADGYPRHAPTGTPILVDGHRTTTVGRVSMDMLACDLTDRPGSGVGSAVTLWGESLPADEVAASAGTVSYELFCALARRVPVVESRE